MNACFEINSNGEIVEYLFLSDKDIYNARANGRIIITKNWINQRLFMPKWDFKNEIWIEGLTEEEVNKFENQIIEHQETTSESEMNAIAIMELAQIVYGGGG
ncbi:hypothetical protein ACFOZ1_06830 [Gracilibacillus marinus]|uniref:Uncharacterized protein n=1 Tax=Gracilibacillus marinus TaxID=630535 RepID=A0ABV8VSS4_9BACI